MTTIPRSQDSRAAREIRKLLGEHLDAVSHFGMGWGSDPYSEVPQWHPMAVALYLKGISAPGAFGELPKSSERQKFALEKLVDIRSPGGGWGLGFSHWGQVPEVPYAITTALVGRALADHHRVSGDQSSLQMAHEAARWLTSDLPWGFRGGGAGPWYAPTIPNVLPNVASMAAGLLFQVATLTGDTSLIPPAQSAVRLVLKAQRSYGAWVYGGTPRPAGGAIRTTDVVDLLHMAYVIDGLLTSSEYGAEPTAVGVAVERALRFLRRWLVREDGFCFEKVLPVDESLPMNELLLSNARLGNEPLHPGHRMLRFPAESRLWGYGALLTATAQARRQGVFGAANVLEAVLSRMVWVHLTGSEGRFRYLGNDDRAFPRHEAHAFAGVCATLQLLSEASTGAVPFG